MLVEFTADIASVNILHCFQKISTSTKAVNVIDIVFLMYLNENSDTLAMWLKELFQVWVIVTAFEVAVI